jgi:hypothetical protein
MKTWQELLLGMHSSDLDEQYGPNSDMVARMLDILSELQWFEHVGEPLPFSVPVIIVHSWNDTLGPISKRDDVKYSANGHLIVPLSECERVIRSNEYHPLWQTICDDAFDATDIMGYIPEELSTGQQDFVFEYIHEYILVLAAEVVATDTIKTTYFREMLPWFYEGHFPCGWEGAWPEGSMRVY